MRTPRKKGFTLIEIIIVVAIVGVLTAILVPTVMAYVKKSKKTATVANGKELWTLAYGLVCDDDEAQKSFYTKVENKWTFFEGTPEGRAVTTYKTNAAKPGDSTLYIQPVVHYNKNDRLASSDNYLFCVVARVDGANHPTGSNRNDATQITNVFHIWDYSDRRYDYFIQKLVNRMELDPNLKRSKEFPLKMPCTDRDDGGMHDVVRWLLCYRINDPEKIEIWAGDGYKAENGPVYRVYPRPCDWYEVA